ncbi:hypothetical protein LOD99_4454 [Oopsacas minuta]|uniref:Uncharacterized protein n=1 Tax=Oopsacas minuta TaxID=111878 RepID=A0AAV7JUV0_9METZ|nr:hypothetical protein LOD99_4454 [Oopsacas minuta]
MLSEVFLLKLCIITGITAYIVGPVQFKIYSRQAGHLVGNLMRIIRKSTAIYEEVSKDKEIAKVSGELKTGIQQLNKIGQQFSIAKNIIRSPSQIVNFANKYEAIGEKSKKEEVKQIESSKDVNLPQKDEVENVQNGPLYKEQVGGAIYVARTTVLIQQHKNDPYSIQDS